LVGFSVASLVECGTGGGMRAVDEP
jgi:hypothetical protein